MTTMMRLTFGQVTPTATGGTETSTTKETKRIVYRLNVKSARAVQGTCR